MSGAKIENNVIQDNQQSGMLDSKGFAGIDIQAADNSKISGNTVTGAGTDYTAFKSCINVKESYNTEVRCNNVDNADRGITFDGYNCDATHLFSNDIHSHDEGLYLENNTVIGDQPFQGNRWFGSAAQIEGFFNFIGYNPAFSNDVKFVNRSEFKVSPIDQSHIFWANPRQVGNWDDMDFKWFKQESAQSEATCATINPTRRLSILNEEVVDGLYEPKDGYTANEREAAIHTFHRLLDYPELRPANSPALTWYNETLPSKIGKLVEAYDWLGDMTNTNVTIESNHSQLENVLLAHKAKQEEISTCSNATQLEILRQELSVINAEIIDAQSDLAQVVGAQTNVSNSEAQAHINALNGLSLLEEDEIDLRRVLVLQLSQCMAPTGYDPAQLSALSAIADKCRIADGLAVVLARSVLGNLDETHTADEECTVPRSAQKSASNTSSTIFPNPTSGVLNLNWAKTVETGKIVLVDLLGHQLKIWSVANTSNFSTMLNDVPAGTYFLNILVDGQAPESKRFFLSK